MSKSLKNMLPSIVKSSTLSPVSGIICAFLSSYIGWGVQLHPAAILILGYTEFSYQQWGDKPIKVVPNNEVATYFVLRYPDIMLIIRNNLFDVYVKYCSKTIDTDAKALAWYTALGSKLQLQFFTSYSLEEVTTYLSISKKRVTNFTKAMKVLKPEQRVEGYLAWYKNYEKILGY
jgi:hypothetical protein